MEQGVNETARIDLHVHSRYSSRPSEWILQTLGFRESYTEPMEIYRIARARGMALVTITDHDTIDGALEIAHLPRAFVSEEVTTRFPDDGCVCHVLAFGLTEAQHVEIQRLRGNIFDLLGFLNGEDIVHALAHPLFPVNERLSVPRLEQLLLLFKNMEVNGARDHTQNTILLAVLSSLTPERVERLADKHGLIPTFPEPWKKNLIGGSDDHSSLNIARSYTEAPGAETVADLLRSIHEGSVRAVSRAPTPRTFARNLYGIGYRHFRSKVMPGSLAGGNDVISFLDQVLRESDGRDRGLWARTVSALSRLVPLQNNRLILPGGFRAFYAGAREAIADGGVTQACGKAGSPDKDDVLFHFSMRVSNRALKHLAGAFLRGFESGNPFALFRTIGDAGSLSTALSPYLVAYSLFSKDRQFNGEILRTLVPDGSAAEAQPAGRSAWFTDIFLEEDPVSRYGTHGTGSGKPGAAALTIVTCAEHPIPESGNLRNFPPAEVCRLAGGSGLRICIPPFLEMLDFSFRENFTHLNALTPGPVGLAGLAVSKLLKVPVYGVYHRGFHRHVQRLACHDTMRRLIWQYLVWFFRQMDAVVVPCHDSAVDLVARGVEESRVLVRPRRTEARAFHPARRNGFLKRRYHAGDGPKILYVGPMVPEANLHLLATVFRRIRPRVSDVHLVLVGDGPCAEKLRHSLHEDGVIFTGPLPDDDLAVVYASCEILVVPGPSVCSSAIARAQASGLPVILTDPMAQRAGIVHGSTGLVVSPGDVDGFTAAVGELLADPARRVKMGTEARRVVEEWSQEDPFQDLWQFFSKIHPPRGF